MPELAEVEFFRKRWSAGHGARVLAVRLHEGKKVFRGTSTTAPRKKLTGPTFPGGGTQTYTNGTDVAIGDNTTVNSPITVSGRTGNGPASASISVNIIHTYKGDLKVDLVAPDGTLYNIHNRTGGSADNVSGTFTKNLTSEALNGTWQLRVNDNAAGDVGRIDTWSITF